MRIGIDARFLTHPQAGGFKTYTKNLIAALAEVDAENQYVLYLDREPDQGTQLPDRPNMATHVMPGSAPLVGMSWREQVKLARRAVHDQLDLLHSPCLTAPLRLPCPSVVTIHDMIWHTPARFSNGKSDSGKRKLMEWYYRFVPRMAAHRAAAVITVSYAAKESIVQHLGIAPDRISVTYEAASPIYRRTSNPQEMEVIREKYNLAPDFVLAIGSADPRKNLKSLVQAYAQLPASLQEQHHLAIIWTHPLMAQESAAQVETLGLKGRVHFLQRVCDQDLVSLYNAASLFVFPSLYEGFGLPPLEAMACGTPVVAADNSSIPEIVEDAALLTDAKDVTAIAESMGQVLVDGALQRELIDKGLRRAASFSWTRCALETLDVYKHAVLV
jgi:glycosyltransferase involved in cell wall biosynthesis